MKREILSLLLKGFLTTAVGLFGAQSRAYMIQKCSDLIQRSKNVTEDAIVARFADLELKDDLDIAARQIFLNPRTQRSLKLQTEPASQREKAHYLSGYPDSEGSNDKQIGEEPDPSERAFLRLLQLSINPWILASSETRRLGPKLRDLAIKVSKKFPLNQVNPSGPQGTGENSSAYALAETLISRDRFIDVELKRILEPEKYYSVDENATEAAEVAEAQERESLYRRMKNCLDSQSKEATKKDLKQFNVRQFGLGYGWMVYGYGSAKNGKDIARLTSGIDFHTIFLPEFIEQKKIQAGQTAKKLGRSFYSYDFLVRSATNVFGTAVSTLAYNQTFESNFADKYVGQFLGGEAQTFFDLGLYKSQFLRPDADKIPISYAQTDARIRHGTLWNAGSAALSLVLREIYARLTCVARQNPTSGRKYLVVRDVLHFLNAPGKSIAFFATQDIVARAYTGRDSNLDQAKPDDQPISPAPLANETSKKTDNSKSQRQP